MAKAKTVFAFDENASLDDNLKIFTDHLIQADLALGAELQRHIPNMLNGSHEADDIWDGLAAAVSVSVSSAAAATASPAASAHVSASGTQPVVSCWLLEGVSIEGFRGVNNQGQPLELKFHLDKVNSVSAVNGVGKSSVHDAVRYAITGRLPWLESLPAAERNGEYYLNRFNTSGSATIKLRLVAEPSGAKCEITVVRDALGGRSASAPPPWDAHAILQDLDREFVFLDGPTFQNFMAARPIDRGRTFSGLLGLSAYSELRQVLAALANTRAFNNHFELTAHAQAKAGQAKVAADSQAAITRDYEALVGTPLTSADVPDAHATCHKALAQIGPLKPHCDGVDFDQIDIDACIEAIKVAEGGPKRERLGACIRERSELSKLNADAPSAERAAQLVSLVEARDGALAKTTGDLILQLYKAGAKVLELPDWPDPQLCPLCNSPAPHDMHTHLAAKLAEFDALDEATRALAVEWGEAGWAGLVSLEAALEPAPEARRIANLQRRAEAGGITHAEADDLVTWLLVLRSKARLADEELTKERTALEQDLPPSSVEVTKKVESARRLQENWRKFVTARDAVAASAAREAVLKRLKAWLDGAATAFAGAEATMGKARLAAVEPVFQDYYKKMWFVGVKPAVSRPSDSEDLRLLLSKFHGLADLSPQALLSESYRNAFAISLYLAAASLYGGRPKFVILDDVTSSFDAGHQNFLVELIRTSFARPGNAAGPQVILLSHDTMLEKLFNRHSNSGCWLHQRLEGSPQTSVLAQAGAVNKVRDRTMSMLQAGQVDSAKEGVRQYLEYRLNDLITKLRVPVPVDIAFNDSKQLAGDFIGAIDAAVKLHDAAHNLVLEPTQVAGLNANMVAIVSNFLSHWGTGQTVSFTGPSLQGVMQAIDDYCDCFTFEPSPGAKRTFYRSLHQRQ